HRAIDQQWGYHPIMPQRRDKGEGLAIAKRHMIDEPHPTRPVPVEPHHLGRVSERLCKQVSVSLPYRETHMTTNTPITPELLDQLLANYEKPEDLTGDGGLFKQLKKARIERALGAELTDHLGYEKGDPAGRGKGNSRNGTSSKTVLTEDGEVEIAVPRDRAG